MNEHKPPGLSWESWAERQIEEGRRAGLFDGLDGEGKPIDGLDGPHDEEWWVKAKLRREEIDYLPPTIAIRGQRDAAVAAALEARDDGRGSLAHRGDQRADPLREQPHCVGSAVLGLGGRRRVDSRTSTPRTGPRLDR